MHHLIKGVLLISLLSTLPGGYVRSERMNNNVTKFEWDATESAPEHYPMEIINIKGSSNVVIKGSKVLTN